MASQADLAREYLAGWNTADADRILGIFLTDAIYADPSAPDRIVGIDAIRQHVKKVLRYWPEQEWTELRQWRHADGFTLLWRATITSPISGKEVTFEGVDVFVTESGKVKELMIYFDPAPWRGLVPKSFVPTGDPA